jgi:hypothetical protein
VAIPEVAKYLFVSHPFVRKLLAEGTLAEELPGDPTGRVNVDVVSVEAYRMEREIAMRAYLDSQTGDSDPVGL